MPQTAGVAATFFNALGKAGVNVLTIAQGQNQRNISAVVDGASSQKAVQVLHAAFLTIVPISVAIVGAGKIAEALLNQLGSRARELTETSGVDIRVVAVSDPPDRS